MAEREHQPPLTVEDQIQNLQALGLIIEDEAYARTFLNDVSYFRLTQMHGMMNHFIKVANLNARWIKPYHSTHTYATYSMLS